jgi:hypothetical protein
VKVIELSKNDVFSVVAGYEAADDKLKGKRLIRCYVDGVSAMDVANNLVYRIYPATEVEVVGVIVNYNIPK